MKEERRAQPVAGDIRGAEYAVGASPDHPDTTRRYRIDSYKPAQQAGRSPFCISNHGWKPDTGALPQYSPG